MRFRNFINIIKLQLTIYLSVTLINHKTQAAPIEITRSLTNNTNHDFVNNVNTINSNVNNYDCEVLYKSLSTRNNEMKILYDIIDNINNLTISNINNDNHISFQLYFYWDEKNKSTKFKFKILFAYDANNLFLRYLKAQFPAVKINIPICDAISKTYNQLQLKNIQNKANLLKNIANFLYLRLNEEQQEHIRSLLEKQLRFPEKILELISNNNGNNYNDSKIPIYYGSQTVTIQQDSITLLFLVFTALLIFASIIVTIFFLTQTSLVFYLFAVIVISISFIIDWILNNF